MALRFMTAEEAASYINNGDNLAFSGFTAAGAPKVITVSLAEKAAKLHAEGKEFKVGMLTGASTGDSLDGVLAKADAVKFRTPYQSNKDMRSSINDGRAPYFDQHLSHLPQNLRYGYYGGIKWAIIEAADVTENGEILLTSGVGIAPTAVNMAEGIFIELNSYHQKSLRGMHDLYTPLDPPYRREIPIYKASDRIGEQILKVDPSKILGVVETNHPDEVGAFAEGDAVTQQIGQNVANFLSHELKTGFIPSSFLPIQSGVGNIANAVLGALEKDKAIPPFEMYTEVIQDSVIGLMESGKCKFASGCSLTLSKTAMDEMYSHIDFFHSRVVLRPQEISNNPEVARRIGIIAMNTALEADIYGNINSTHVLGTKMMNGIGGSGDFTRNAYVSIYSCPSVAKGGKISAFVPMVSHLDHSEHSVSIIITEQGIADLRGKSPIERAKTIIENCVHPDYKEQLRDYMKICAKGQTPHNLAAAFGMHTQFQETGDMHNVDWSKYTK